MILHLKPKVVICIDLQFMQNREFLLYQMYLKKTLRILICFQLALLFSYLYFSFLYWSPSPYLLPLCIAFDTISSKTDEVLSINPSANVFVFGELRAHHWDWLTYFGGTDGPGKLCYDFSISNKLTKMVNFSTWIPD